jgi:hypothetical protein
MIAPTRAWAASASADVLALHQPHRVTRIYTSAGKNFSRVVPDAAGD